MKSVIIVAAACLLTAGVTLFAVALGINLKDRSGELPASDDVSNEAAVFAEAASDLLDGTIIEDPEETSDTETAAGSAGNIIIPGFAQLTFKAGTKEQNVKLYNPKENFCYFMITILLADNTEIYQSELLAPGSSLTKIKLSKVLEPGIYEDAILRYSCFDMETLKGLNGANTKFTLEVIE